MIVKEVVVARVQRVPWMVMEYLVKESGVP